MQLDDVPHIATLKFPLRQNFLDIPFPLSGFLTHLPKSIQKLPNILWGFYGLQNPKCQLKATC